jgi:hypothetical protein
MEAQLQTNEKKFKLRMLQAGKRRRKGRSDFLQEMHAGP